MRKVTVLILTPLLLFALERVNLIKNHSFEKEATSWQAYTGAREIAENDSAKASAHDSTCSSSGFYSGSNDTRFQPGGSPSPLFIDSSVVIQGFTTTKELKDLDSLSWMMKVIAPGNTYNRIGIFMLILEMNMSSPGWLFCVYSYHGPNLNSAGEDAHHKIYNFEVQDDTTWIKWERSIYTDWITSRGLSPTLVFDSAALVGYGLIDGGWFGQKVYWDGIRLTGYADYDVGVKEILSPQGLGPGDPLTPKARIKNFGRKPADTFLVIAEAWKKGDTLYRDTLPWSLAADTEDTLEFATWDSPEHCTLTVRTVMTPDESDEDDAVWQWIAIIGIEEPVTPVTHPTLQLEFARNTPSSFLCTYSLPQGEQGIISLYDPTGRRIESLRVQGEGKVSLEAGLATGVYFIRLETGHSSIVRKAIVLN